MQRPAASEHIPYYSNYIDLVPEGNLLEILTAQIATVTALTEGVTEERSGYRYAAGKWSLREMLCHILDSDRVFASRAMAFARGETQALPGYEQDDYIAASAADACNFAELGREFAALREGNVWMFRHLPAAAWTRTGIANNDRISVRALAYILAGHVIHHLRIVHERYGV